MKKVTEIKKATTLKDLHESMVPKGTATVTSQDDGDICDTNVTDIDIAINGDTEVMSEIDKSDKRKHTEFNELNVGNMKTTEANTEELYNKGNDGVRNFFGANDAVSLENNVHSLEDLSKTETVQSKSITGQSLNDSESAIDINSNSGTSDGTRVNSKTTDEINKVDTQSAPVKPKMVYFFERGDSLKKEDYENANLLLSNGSRNEESDKSKTKGYEKRREKRKGDKEVSMCCSVVFKFIILIPSGNY